MSAAVVVKQLGQQDTKIKVKLKQAAPYFTLTKNNISGLTGTLTINGMNATLTIDSAPVIPIPCPFRPCVACRGPQAMEIHVHVHVHNMGCK